MRTSESKAATAGFLLIVAILIVNAGLSHWNTLRLVENERRVSHTHEVLEKLNEIEATVADAETGQRGYLITGGAKYLQTYHAAVGRIQQQLARLNQLTADNPEQQARTVKLRALVQSRLDRLQHNAAVRKTEGFQAAQQIVGTDQGQLLMEQIRSTAQAMQAVENKLLTQRAAETSRSLNVKIVTNVVGTLLGAAAVCLAFYLFRRTLAERRSAEKYERLLARREAALGEIRQRALSDDKIDVLFDKSSRLIAETLDVPLVKVLELLPDGRDFLLRAGVGWSEARLGETKVSAALDSQAGFTLRSSEPVVRGDLTTHQPVIVRDLRSETRFSGPPFLLRHGVVSGISVIIYGQPDQPFGVLGAHTTHERQFTDDEAHFLQTMANVLAAAIQRRRAEVALRDSENRFRALADSVPEIVWTSLPDGRCDYVNRRWYEFTGMSLTETLGFGWVAALHEDDAQRSTDRWMHSMKTGEPFQCEYRFRKKDGTYRWCLGRALPMEDENKQIVKWFGNCMDIDQRKRMEVALKDADRRKDEFLAMLGHELRNPLTPITSAVEMLRLKSPADPDIRWSVDTIVHQSDQIIRLVDDLLDVSRIVHGKIRLEPEMVDLRTIAERAVEMCQPLIEAKQHQLTMSLSDEPIQLMADPTRLIQVVENLLTNAVKYTQEKGHIWLSTGRDKDQAVLRVRDNGIGIADDVLPNVFDLFMQEENPFVHSQGGLGLGLRLVSNLVQMHGGSVQAESEGPEQGSEFIVRIPLSFDVPQAKPLPESAPAISASAPASPHVLVVDDRSNVRDALARLLQMKGYQVRSAGTADEALAESQAFEPSVVLTDIGLPGTDGFELAVRLRKQPVTEHAVLIALTGFADKDVRCRAREAGFDHLLMKPPNLTELYALLTSAGKPSERVAAPIAEEKAKRG